MYDDDFDALAGTTSAAFMSARAPVIRSNPGTPTVYKASSLKRPLNGLLKGNRLKRRSVTFAPNALTWSHEGTQSRQRIKDYEEDFDDHLAMQDSSNKNHHRPCTPTVKEQFSHLPKFLQPEAPTVNGAVQDASDSDTDPSADSDSDEEYYTSPEPMPKPSPRGAAAAMNGVSHHRGGGEGADDGGEPGDSGSDSDSSDRSASALSVNSAATNIETDEEDGGNGGEAQKNGEAADEEAAGDNDSDASMIAGDASDNNSDGSVVFGSDGGGSNNDDEVPEFAKKKPATLPSLRTARRLRTGILGNPGSPLAAAKRGLAEGLTQLGGGGNNRFQPRLNSWSKKRREMRGLRPPPSYSRLQARKAMEAPSPIRRSNVYSAPSPTNAQGEESNTPKESRVKQALDFGSQPVSTTAPAILTTPEIMRANIARAGGSASDSSPPTVARSAPSNGIKQVNGVNGAKDAAGSSSPSSSSSVTPAQLKEVRTEIDSLKQMTHSVIEKLDTLTARFSEIQELNLVNRLDTHAEGVADLKRVVASLHQSTNDRITDLSTTVEAFSNNVSSSHKALMAASPAHHSSSTSSRSQHSPSRSRNASVNPSPMASATANGFMFPPSSSTSAGGDSVSSRPFSSALTASGGGGIPDFERSSSSVDSLQESISELRAFTKESFANFMRLQKAQRRELALHVTPLGSPMPKSPRGANTPRAFSSAKSPRSSLRRRNSSSSSLRRGRGGPAGSRRNSSSSQQQVAAMSMSRAGARTQSSSSAAAVRPRLWGYGSMAFLVMLVLMMWHFFPMILPHVEDFWSR